MTGARFVKAVYADVFMQIGRVSDYIEYRRSYGRP